MLFAIAIALRTSYVSRYQPTEQSSEVIDLLQNVLATKFSNETWYDETSAQYHALKWMTNFDTFWPSTNQSTIIERYVIAVLYFSTNGWASWPSTMEFYRNESICQRPPNDSGPTIWCDDLGSIQSIEFGE